MNHQKIHYKTIIYIFMLAIFTAFAVFGLSLFTQNNSDSNVKNSKASIQEPADINNDNKVDIFDLSTLLGNWNVTGASTSDLNSDNVVNIFDLSQLLSKWGTTIVVSTRPDATNTGVPTGVTLVPLTTAYPNATTKGYTVNAQGRVYINKDGETYENVSFTNGVVVRAKNITIKNSRITAGRASFGSLLAEPSSWADCRAMRTTLEAAGQSPPSVFVLDANGSTVSNFILEDSEIAVTDYSIYISNYMGHDTTMRRVDISGGVDNIGTHNGYATTANFTLEDSWLHDLYRGQWSVGNYNTNPASPTVRMYCGYDAAHPEATHNDNIQMHDGANVNILRNNIIAKPVNHVQANAGIMMNGAGNVLVDGNYFQYGLCSINMVSTLILPITVSNNTFYGNNNSGATGGQNDSACAIIRPASAGYTFTNNLWENSLPIKLTNGG